MGRVLLIFIVNWPKCRHFFLGRKSPIQPKQIGVQPFMAAVNVPLLAYAADRHAAVRCAAAAPLLLGARHPLLSIDIICLQGTQQQTRHTLLLWSIDGTDKRMDALTFT